MPFPGSPLYSSSTFSKQPSTSISCEHLISFAVTAFCTCTVSADVRRSRQYRCYSRTKPPPELADHLSDETFNKAQAYGRAKAHFGLIRGVYGIAEGLAYITFDLYAGFWNLSGRIMQRVGLAPSRTVRGIHRGQS